MPTRSGYFFWYNMEDKKSYYAVIPAEVRYDKSLKPNAKLLYGEITALCNEKGYCWASNNYFAQLYEVTTVAVSQWVRALRESGYVTCELIKSEKGQVTERRIYIRVLTSVYGGINKTLIGYKENFKGNTTVNIKDNNTELIKQIVEYLNIKTVSKYKPDTRATQIHINARIAEGFIYEDFKKVIDVKTAEWTDTDRAIYLRPETLFGNKFQSYLNQKNTKKQEPVKIIIPKPPVCIKCGGTVIEKLTHTAQCEQCRQIYEFINGIWKDIE